jgi:phosphoglycolate phosphatase-like HAD superfamily hydrolase
MIKTILWDFDGVILDSMKIKGDGFVELFKEYSDENLKMIEKYHYDNGGISRFEKIKYFYSYVLKKNIMEDEVLMFANKFAEIIKRKLKHSDNLITETINFIEKNYLKYNFHIVSGTEHYELKSLCDFFELTNYFVSIEGSPIKKNILVSNIIHKYNYKKQEIILIGDSLNDYYAARLNLIEFYGYNNDILRQYKYIDSFNNFRV